MFRAAKMVRTVDDSRALNALCVPALIIAASGKLAGERSTRIFGEGIAVTAEVVNAPGLSADADAAKLTAWLRSCPNAPRHVVVTHGAPGPADAPAPAPARRASRINWAGRRARR